MEIVMIYIHYLPCVVVSVGLMMVVAYIKLRYSVPIYTVNSKLLVKKNSNPYSSSNEKFDDIFMIQGSGTNNLNDEMEIIRSRLMAIRVVKSLHLQQQYYVKGKIRTSAVYGKDLPCNFTLAEPKD